MVNRSVTVALVIVLGVVFVSACTQSGPGTRKPTTTLGPPATVPISGYLIRGSINQFKCGLSGCKLSPAAVTVHVMDKSNRVVNQTNSFGANGDFTISVPAPGTYSVHVSTPGHQCTTPKVDLTPAAPVATVPDTIVCR